MLPQVPPDLNPARSLEISRSGQAVLRPPVSLEYLLAVLSCNKGDDQMNSDRTTRISEREELANINRHSVRKIALAGGILYLLTFVSMPIGFLYMSVLN